MLQLSMGIEEFQIYVVNQLFNLFPDRKIDIKDPLFQKSFYSALERTEYCFKHVSFPTYHNNGDTYLSHLHSDQYTMFLWYLSNSIWKKYEDDKLASKIFYLNKTLNSVLCMYDNKMPDIFLIIHGGGVVLGKATYADFFVCCQGCTVGAVHGVYPVLGKGVAMAPQSVIIGNCNVGNYSTIGNQSLLRNLDLEERTLYFRDIKSGKHDKKLHNISWAQSFFNIPIL